MLATAMLKMIMNSKGSSTLLPERAQQWIMEGIEDYLENGTPLEEALQLRGMDASTGRHQYFMAARNNAILDAWLIIRERKPDLSRRRAAHLVHGLLGQLTNEAKQDTGLHQAIQDAQLAIKQLNKEIPKADSVWEIIRERIAKEARKAEGVGVNTIEKD